MIEYDNLARFIARSAALDGRGLEIVIATSGIEALEQEFTAVLTDLSHTKNKKKSR